MDVPRVLTAGAALIAPALLGAFVTPSGVWANVRYGSAPAGSRPPLLSRPAPLSRPALRGADGIALSLPEPEGCSTTVSSFVGLPAGKNYAGGGSGMSGYAAVAGGYTDEACDYESFIGAGQNNVVGGDGAGYQTAIVAGAYNGARVSAASAIVSGYGNLLSYASPYANSNLSLIGAGQDNQIAAPASFIGAGYSNSIVASSNVSASLGQSAFIGGGADNSDGANFASIVGGSNNSLGGTGVLGEFGFIGGGQSNTLTGEWAGIASGKENKASGSNAFVGGGTGNSAAASYAFVGAGSDNNASGDYATIPGGSQNTASGPYSFAGGLHSLAANYGSFVWSDAAPGATQLKSQANNQFLVRASGGVAIYSNATLTSGVKLAAGGGSWASLSDRTVKTDIRALDDAGVLAKVAALPVTEWKYRSEPGVRHVGPMAQDFYAAFGLGEDDRHITTIDEDGIALAAIKALHAENAGLHADNAGLHAENAGLRERLSALERAVAVLARRRTR